MRKLFFAKDYETLRGDLLGGVTTGIVALPLALALGVASGLGPIAGLYGAIILGFFAALFGGTPSQISGPTGPMVVVIAGLAASFAGRLDLVLIAIALAGLLQILFGVLRFGDYIRLVPYPVISGFMSGIGVIIISLQLARLFGHETSGDPVSALLLIPQAVANPVWVSCLVAGVALLIVFFWPTGWGKKLPAPLAALIGGVGISFLVPGAAILGDIPSGLPSLHLFEMPVRADWLLILEAAFILALLGSIDSLLTSLVADNMTRTRHDSNKELIGQGIGNFIAGLFGAAAGAGATMRTVVNIRSGGRTPLSGMVHALILLTIALGLGPLASHIPHAVLAAILVKVGFDIIDWSYLRRAHKGRLADLLLMLVVLLLTVFVDLITAVAVGVVIAALAFVRETARAQLSALNTQIPELPDAEEIALLQKLEDRALIFRFTGPLSFGAAADLGHHIRGYSNGQARALILDFSGQNSLDLSACRAIETVTEDAKSDGKTVSIIGLKPELKKVLMGLNAARFIPDDAYFDRRLDALRAVSQQTS